MTRKIQPSMRGASIDKLTAKQQLFVTLMKSDPKMTGAEAARQAGYAGPHYSQVAAKVLKLPAVKKHLGKQMTDVINKFELKGERVLQELMLIAFANPKDMLDANGNMLPMHLWPEELARAVSGFDIKTKTYIDADGNPQTETELKPRFWNKIGAADLLGKYLTLWKENAPKDDANNTAVSEKGAELLLELMKGVAQRSNVIDGRIINQRLLEQTQTIDADTSGTR